MSSSFDLEQEISELGIEKTHISPEARKKYKRAYESWSKREDDLLYKASIVYNMSVDKLSCLFQRSENSINIRLLQLTQHYWIRWRCFQCGEYKPHEVVELTNYSSEHVNDSYVKRNICFKCRTLDYPMWRK